MKHLIKIISVLLLMATAGTAMAYDFMVDGVAYRINDDGTTASVTYTVYNNYGNYPDLTVANIKPSVTHDGQTYNVTAIDEVAFQYCYTLTSVTIPEGITKIGEWAFCFCNELKSVNLPKTVTKVGYDAFGHCATLGSIEIDSDNPVYDSRDNCNAIIETETGNLLFGCNSTVIPNGVTVICEDAFWGLSGLESVTIPPTVTKIDTYAFGVCSGLKSVFISKSVAELSDQVFADCINLDNIVVDSENPYYDSRDNCNAIIKTETNKLVYGSNNTVIPNTVTSIGDHAFWGRNGLTSIYIPSSVEQIESYAFCNCPAIESIVVDSENPVFNSRDNCNAILYYDSYLMYGCKNTVIPDCVKTIYYNAFQGCTGLTEFSIPENVTTIANNVFRDCSSLKRIDIPKSITALGSYIFWGCSSLELIHCEIEDIDAVRQGNSMFYRVPTSTCILEVPAGTKQAYQNAPQWKDFLNIREIGEAEPGDVDGNGEVNGADLNILINIVLGKDQAGNYDGRANVDGQGGVDGSDINALINILLGK